MTRDKLFGFETKSLSPMFREKTLPIMEKVSENLPPTPGRYYNAKYDNISRKNRKKRKCKLNGFHSKATRSSFDEAKNGYGKDLMPSPASYTVQGNMARKLFQNNHTGNSAGFSEKTLQI